MPSIVRLGIFSLEVGQEDGNARFSTNATSGAAKPAGNFSVGDGGSEARTETRLGNRESRDFASLHTAT
jgi:hypothetical protein